MKYTENYGFLMPEDNEYFDQQGHANHVTDQIDATIKEVEDKVNDHDQDYTSNVPYGGTTTNAGNAYYLAAPAITSLADHKAVSFMVNANSTGPVTLNWAGTGAKAVVKPNGAPVTNWKTNGIYTVRYNVTAGNFMQQGSDSAGNATAADLLSGKTASTDVGDIVGTMPSKGAATITPSTVDQTILAGRYLSGAQTIESIGGDAAVGDVLAAKSFGSNIAGRLKIGTMPNRGAVSITPGAADQAIAAGYHNGLGVVAGDADLVAANIKSGKNIFGVTGIVNPTGIKSIQQISITISSPDTYSEVLISEVNFDSTAVFFLGNTGSVNNGDHSFAVVGLVDSTHVYARRDEYSGGGGGSGTVIANALIVEFEPNAIKTKQSGQCYIEQNNTARTTTITEVDTSKSLLVYRGCISGNASSPTLPTEKSRVFLTNSTTITGTRAQASSGHYALVSWDLLELV